MIDEPRTTVGRDLASMGPRSDNRGYEIMPVFDKGGQVLLQWVHGPITVVMGTPAALLL